MGKLGERARRENLGEGGFKRLVDRERERLRIAFARSKNAQTLRETVVDFWARGGTNKELQADGLMKVLPLFSDVNWREARDLALLALISYQPKDRKSTRLNSSHLVISYAVFCLKKKIIIIIRIK